MIKYSKQDMQSLLSFLEGKRANLGPIDGKNYRPLVKAIMHNNGRSSGAILLAIQEEDEGSFVFLTMVPLSEIPLHISTGQFRVLAQWRLETGK